ncbi:hypothetical protein SteCoe_33950 [Stentor coeruleus]|uniref:CSC1/OSCA1-like cytosolic domain-containing protein n=1 Tax=Stentor coeruleus TaxID=5963 RepID=A0A1R2AVK2_9CILI|nr:hypothetical protein SteCoe_33950 [Stentor coeruleus]
MSDYSDNADSEIDEPNDKENPYTTSGDIKINITSSSFRKSTLNLKKAADLRIAKIHGDAHKVFKFPALVQTDEVKKCECCMFPLTGEPFNYFESLDALAELGSSFPLFFILSKSILFYMAIVFCVACIPCLVANIIQQKACLWNDSAGLTYLTFGNYGNPWEKEDDSNQVPYWQPILHLISVFLLIIFAPFISKIILNKSVEFDLNLTTPSDFTLWIKGLPKEYTTEELEEFFITKSKQNNVRIANINSAYDIREFVKVSKSLLEWETTLEFIKNFKLENPGRYPKKGFLCFKKIFPSEIVCEKNIEELKKKEENFCNSLNEKLTSVAFVTFTSQIDARVLAKQFRMSSLKKFLISAKMKVLKSQNRLFKGHFITTEMAPEPSDVYWENLSAGYLSKQIRRIITYSIALLTIGITFIVLFFIKNYQKSNSNTHGSAKYIGSAFSSLLVISINIFLSISIRIYSKEEMHHTWSTYNLSVSKKLVIALFLNTGIIPLVISYNYITDWFNTGGLANNIFWIQVANAIINPLLYLIYPSYLLKKIIRWFKSRNGLKGMSQYEANLLFEGPEVDLADRFANILKSCLVSIFYAPLVPVGVLVTIIGIVLEVLVFKLMLIKVHSRPRKQSKTLAIEISKWLRRLPSVYAGGILIFYYPYILEIRQVLVGLLIVVCVYNMLYIETFIDSKFEDNSIDVLMQLCKSDGSDDYFKFISEFFTDYERENPVTQAEGWEKWFKNIDEKDGYQGRDYSMLKRGNFKLDAINQYAAKLLAENKQNLRDGTRKKSSMMQFAISSPRTTKRLSPRQRGTVADMMYNEFTGNVERIEVVAKPKKKAENIESTPQFLGFTGYSKYKAGNQA